MPESMRPLRTSSKALKMLLTAQHPPVSGQYWEVRPDRKLQHGRRPDRRCRAMPLLDGRWNSHANAGVDAPASAVNLDKARNIDVTRTERHSALALCVLLRSSTTGRRNTSVTGMMCCTPWISRPSLDDGAVQSRGEERAYLGPCCRSSCGSAHDGVAFRGDAVTKPCPRWEAPILPSMAF